MGIFWEKYILVTIWSYLQSQIYNQILSNSVFQNS